MTSHKPTSVRDKPRYKRTAGCLFTGMLVAELRVQSIGGKFLEDLVLTGSTKHLLTRSHSSNLGELCKNIFHMICEMNANTNCISHYLCSPTRSTPTKST